MDLSNLSPAAGSKTSNNFRRGRGHASGNGKTAGKGHKGQKARSGGGVRIGFEGGQMPLYRRIPKKGFQNINHKVIMIVTLDQLNQFEDGEVVTVDSLIESGMVNTKNIRNGYKKPYDGVKVLGTGELTKKLTVKANAFSASAKEKIEAVGGKAEVI